jgi:aryl-alcohol dehydrogenase-like predicted oxidoreductase
VDHLRLGSAGLKVSRIGLGMMSYGSQAERAWHLDETAAEPCAGRGQPHATDEEVRRLDELYLPHTVLGHH